MLQLTHILVLDCFYCRFDCTSQVNYMYCYKYNINSQLYSALGDVLKLQC